MWELLIVLPFIMAVPYSAVAAFVKVPKLFAFLTSVQLDFLDLLIVIKKRNKKHCWA